MLHISAAALFSMQGMGAELVTQAQRRRCEHGCCLVSENLHLTNKFELHSTPEGPGSPFSPVGPIGPKGPGSPMRPLSP